jgi:secreted PhoX family phosphatase
MAISPDGLNVYFTQGPYYMGVSTAAGNAVTTTKRCFPTELTRNGFDSVDGMTIDGAGNVYVAKGSHYMGVKGGSVVQKKTVHLKAATDLIGTSLDALSVSPDGTVIIVKGAEYVSVKGGVVVGGKKNAVPAEITKAGFSTIQGLSITGDGSVYVAAAGQYMSVDKNGAVKDKKQAFPSSITSAGFSNLDGFHIAADGSVIVAKDAYYMVVSKNNVVTTKKSPLPSSITNELCGSSAYCVGPVTGSGAPTMYGMATSVAGAGQGTTAKAGLPRSLFALPMLMLAAAAML